MQHPTASPALVALKLEGFILHYRRSTPVVIGSVIGVMLLMLIQTPLPVALTYGAFQLVLSAIMIASVERAACTADAALAMTALSWRTGSLQFLSSLHAVGIALWIRQSANVPLRMEAALMIIGVLIMMAMQMHMSRRAYAASLAPPFFALVLIALQTRDGQNLHLAAATALFALAMIALTWRQQSADKSMADMRLDLIIKNQRLTALVAEAEAERRNAEAASRAKTDFLAMTSHEIRTPLNGVLGLAQALRREPLTPVQDEMVRGVLDAGSLLTRLLNAILDITRIEAGKMTLNNAAFDLSEMARTVSRVWTPVAQDKGVELTLNLDGLPSEAWLIADGGKIEQTLVNLVSNALKFTHAGGKVEVRLASRTQGDDSLIEVEVSDDGPGVPAADRSRIFQPFEQTDDGRSHGGAGLGLAICAGSVALMNGKIGVRESSSGGACFFFSFAAPAAEAPDAADTAPDSAWMSERALRVLAAEDNPGNRQVLQALFSTLPFSLSLAVNGQEALDAIDREAFDLVLMDANMPVMDGIAALRRIRARADAAAATPVWMLTANVFDEDVARYVAAGADGVLRKPIDLRELLALLSQIAEPSETPAANAA